MRAQSFRTKGMLVNPTVDFALRAGALAAALACPAPFQGWAQTPMPAAPAAAAAAAAPAATPAATTPAATTPRDAGAGQSDQRRTRIDLGL